MANNSRASAPGSSQPSKFPGERLGLPAQGPRSVGRVGRRILALIIDWLIATLLTNALTGSWDAAVNARPLHQLATYGVWVGLMIVVVPILGGTLGHRLTGLAVAPLGGGWPGVWRPLVRALLLALVIPALVWDLDQRGFHDKASGTVLLRS